MARNQPERHGWLRGALADKGKRATDLATAWGVDDSMVSRFIIKGEPALTYARMEILSRVTGLDFEQLRIKLASKPVPLEVLDKSNGHGDTDPGEALDKEFEAMLYKMRAYYEPKGFRVYGSVEKIFDGRRGK